ncbi:MAG TPA: PH domain-containing protein [Chthoniobacterales bacterium]|nr:PH domain-containing protein [Chthoniobacterales bacterium]
MLPDHSPSPHPAEVSLWKGHTSQWTYFWTYAACGALAIAALAGIPFTGGLSAIGLVIPLAWWAVRWWTNRTTTYELTSQRLRISRGVLNRRLDEIELYRVKDYVMEQPLFLRLLGLGNITLISSDATTPAVVLRAIPGVETVREQIRTSVQTERDRKRVRELDVDDPTPLS